MTKRKFYKTIISFEVLSEEPVHPTMHITDIVNECINGDWSMRTLNNRQTIINGKQAAQGLIRQGSDPSFFGLDNKGNNQS